MVSPVYHTKSTTDWCVLSPQKTVVMIFTRGYWLQQTLLTWQEMLSPSRTLFTNDQCPHRSPNLWCILTHRIYILFTNEYCWTCTIHKWMLSPLGHCSRSECSPLLMLFFIDKGEIHMYFHFTFPYPLVRQICYVPLLAAPLHWMIILRKRIMRML